MDKVVSAIFFCIFIVHLTNANFTYWTSSYDNLTSWRPAGKENNVILYTCRTRVKQDIVVGKLMHHINPPTCNTAYMGKSHKSASFEVLRDSTETTSWVQYNGATDINNIVGGQISRRPTFVCRAFMRNWLIPGYLSLQTNACHVEIGPGGLELYHEVKEDFEVLVINKYGMLNGNPACLSY